MKGIKIKTSHASNNSRLGPYRDKWHTFRKTLSSTRLLKSSASMNYYWYSDLYKVLTSGKTISRLGIIHNFPFLIDDFSSRIVEGLIISILRPSLILANLKPILAKGTSVKNIKQHVHVYVQFHGS